MDGNKLFSNFALKKSSGIFQRQSETQCVLAGNNSIKAERDLLRF